MAKLDCAKSIRNLASLYRDMEVAAATLEALGSIEQAQTEAESRLTKVKGEIDFLSAEREKSADELAAAKAAHAEALREQSELLLSKRLDADAAMAKRTAESEAEITEAKRAADEAREKIALEIERDKAEAQAYVEDQVRKGAEQEAIFNARAKELSQLEAQLEKVREKLRGLLG
jgi:hypothetical protein